MDEERIRARVRGMLETGALPCDDAQQMWAGRGGGERCAACTERIDAAEVEYEVELSSGTVLRLHRRCHGIWFEECQPLRR
jgi:hypothetical protein